MVETEGLWEGKGYEGLCVLLWRHKTFCTTFESTAKDKLKD